MQKTKKALKNNLVKLQVKNSHFILKNSLQGNIDSKRKTLTSNTISQTEVNRVVDSSSIKFPVVLETFKNLESLKKELTNIKKNSLERNLVIVKYNNLFFKNKSSSIIITKQDTDKTFILLKNLCYKIPYLFLLHNFIKKS